MSILTTEKNLSAQIVTNIQQKFDVTLKGVRTEALAFLQGGLPTTKHEEFKHTPLTRELEKNFSFSGAISPLTEVKVDPFLLQNIDADVIVYVNGVFSPAHSQITPGAYTILPLMDALEKNEIAKQHFGKYVNHLADAFVAWNTAGWDQGMFIHVPDNTIIERPIIFYHIHDDANEVTALCRNLVVVGRSSEATVIEKFDSAQQGNHFLNIVNEVFVAENAGFDFYSLQNDTGKRYQYNLTQIYQQKISRVNTFTFTVNGKVMRNNLQLALDGEGIESHMYGLYLTTGDTLADNHTVVDHKKPNSFSNEFYKGIMDGSSKGVFNGKIYVRPDAQKTNAFQANRNVLLTDTASVNTKPQLEIWADDVKCSHGCTSGQLDEEAVFYLQTRGISKQSARAMMLYAFAGEVIEKVKHPVIREYLDNLISERLHKNF
ncbi:MAG TPA: Fe-S cluster assembly protein SufD [Chryseosolibacter sp.]|nr:Fe-S cluster assembly protein SufD [Chryseosolibacter sp.]